MAWLGKKAMQQMGKRMERSAGFNPFESQEKSNESGKFTGQMLSLVECLPIN